jgi:Spy/CpxP family protein refolding chaperone
MERIEMMRMWRMTEDLELTEEEGAALFPALRKIERERKELNRERGEIMRELRATLRGEHPDTDTLRDLLDRLERNRESARRLDDREADRVKSLLDPERVARYIVFQHDFEREIREIILQSRRHGSRHDAPERRPGRAFDRPPPVDRPPR